VRKPRPPGLIVYILTIFTLLTFGITAAVALVSQRQLTSHALRQQIGYARNLYADISFAAADHLFSESYGNLQFIVDEFSSRSLLLELKIANRWGTVVADMHREHLGREMPSPQVADEGAVPPPEARDMPAVTVHENNRTVSIRGAIAIGNVDLGSLLMVFNLQPTYDQLSVLYRRIISLSLVIWSAAMIFGVVANRELVLPLRRLTEVFDDLSNGGNSPLPLSPPIREFRELGDSFTRTRDQILNREREIIEARDRAERANEAKTRFLLNTSHELRTPLNGIIGFAELLKTEDLTGDQRDAVDVILHSAGSLSSMIRDLLDLVELETGSVVPLVRTFDLANMADDLCTQAELECGNRGLDIRCEVQTADRPFAGDRERISQIASILIGNALKFTSDGYVALAITADETGGLRLSVEDSGPGIPAERRTMIFDSLDQGSNPLTKDQRGLGLGLYIAGKLTSLLGGVLSLEDPPGGGSRFVAVFPPAVPPIGKSGTEEGDGGQPKGGHSGAQSAGAPAPGYSGGCPDLSACPGSIGPEVLVVEDDAINRMYLSRILCKAGYTPIEAADGDEALREYRQRVPQVVLMDIGLPRQSGIEVCSMIMATEEFEKRPASVFAVTANNQSEIREECFRRGMAGFIAKPYTPRQILSAIEHALGESG
jgi:signal transduction histidine kinase/CheY-like chemotaxis protein